MQQLLDELENLEKGEEEVDEEYKQMLPWRASEGTFAWLSR